MRHRGLVLIGYLAVAFAAGACSFDISGVALGGADAAQPADARVDGAPGEPDAAPGDIDAAPPAPVHLLITEVGLEPDGNEFVEIYNPGSATVPLANYYLADNVQYSQLAGAFGDGPAPSYVDGTDDFIAKFPDGASIGPGEVKVIAVSATAFGSAFDFAVIGSAEVNIAMVETKAGLVTSGPHLTNGGELVVLFYWDGTSDRVSDVDMVFAGTPDGNNFYSAKNDIAVDGPDADTDTTAYTGDADTLPTAMSNKAGSGNSHKRIALEDGYEQRDVGGNGLFGDDETSEDTAMTWDAAGPFSPSTPGTVPASLSGQ